MAHDPAPVSASLYRLRRQTALRGTVSPSSRRHGRGGQRTALRATGAGRDEYSHHPASGPLSMGASVSGPTGPSWRGRRWSSGRSSPTAKPSKSAHPPTRQSLPKPGRAVFGSREHARGRGIDGPPEDSLRRSRRAKRWPKEDRRFLSLPHATKGAADCPPRAAHPFPIILLTVQCFEMPSTEPDRFVSDRGYLPGLLRWALHPMAWALLLFPGAGLAQSGGRDAWFPDAEYFPRPTASVREPTLGLGVVWTTVFRDRADPAERPPFDLQGGNGLEADLQGEAALGGNVRIWQPVQWADGGLTLGIQAGIFGRFRLEVSSNDLVASDWIVALPAEIARGPWSGRLRLQHWSAHVGDELIEQGVERVDFTTETLEALVAYGSDAFRLYGGGSLVVRSSLENEVQLGSAFSDDVLIRFGGDARVRPWARDDITVDGGVDWHSSDRTGWAGQLSVRLGLAVQDGTHKARLSGVYHRGPSPMGQFFLTNERYWGIELFLEP